jgi:uncharacterized membrane protein YkvA (DUF1232 family)
MSVFTASPRPDDESVVRAGSWTKLRRAVAQVGFARDAVAAYLCATDDNTPGWVKIALFAALAYFISPVDAIPDALPIIGYADDGAVIAGAIAAVGDHLTPRHRRDAVDWLRGVA